MDHSSVFTWGMHALHVTPHTSHLTPHTSHLTPHTSHLTPNINTPFQFSHLTGERPSSLLVHPTSGDLYVASAATNAVLVYVLDP